MLAGIPVNLVTGSDAAAKSRLVGELLRRRPSGERWAVLVNEAGAGSLPQDRDGIYVSEVTQGCICCTAQLPLRVGLTRLLRETEPDRLFIQVPGQARTGEVVRMIADQWLAPVLSARATIHVVAVQAVQAALSNPEYAAQLAAAQVIAVADDEAGAAQFSEAEQRLALLSCAPRVVRWTAGNFDLAMLDLAGNAPSPRFPTGESKLAR